MGFVDTESSSSSLLPTSTEDENETGEGYEDDEESKIGKASPFFKTTFKNQNRHRSQSNDTRTPTTRNNDLLSATRPRRKTVTESQEIWEELEDALPLPLPLSPWSLPPRRSTSIRSTPSRPPVSRSGLSANAEEGNADTGDADDEIPDEETTLLGRSCTGRTYRDRRRRRSAPMLGGEEGARGGEAQQAATGGWWRMGWWVGEDGKGKKQGVSEGAV